MPRTGANEAKGAKDVRIRGSPEMSVVATTFSFFVGFAAVSLFGPTVHRLKKVLDLSPMQRSWMVSAPVLTGSLLRIPGGAWADAAGARKPVLSLMCVSILGMVGVTCVLSQLSPDSPVNVVYPLLLALGVLCGCGIATFSSGISQVSYWFPQGAQGKVLGVYAGLGNLSPGFATLALPYLLKGIGLVKTYILWLVILVVGTVFYFLMGRNAWYFQLRDKKLTHEEAKEVAREKFGQELFPKGNAVEGLKAAALVWQTWALVFVYFVTFGGLVALTGSLPTYWTELHGFSPTSAGALAAAFSLISCVIRTLGGLPSDVLGGEKTLMLAMGVVAVGALMMMLTEDFDVNFAGTLTLSIGMGIGNAAVFKLVPQTVPRAVGGAAGLVGGVGAFGGFLLPPAMALFVKREGREGYSHAYVLFVVLAVLGLIASAILLCAKCSASHESEDESEASGSDFEERGHEDSADSS